MKAETGDRDVHLGRNIKCLMGVMGLTREYVADSIGITKDEMRRIEMSEDLDDAILDGIAATLKVPVDLIRNYDHEKTTSFVINNNTIDTLTGGGVFNTNKGDNDNALTDNTYNLNPVDKLIEVYDQRVNELKEQIADLKQEVKELKAKLK